MACNKRYHGNAQEMQLYIRSRNEPNNQIRILCWFIAADDIKKLSDPDKQVEYLLGLMDLCGEYLRDELCLRCGCFEGESTTSENEDIITVNMIATGIALLEYIAFEQTIHPVHDHGELAQTIFNNRLEIIAAIKEYEEQGGGLLLLQEISQHIPSSVIFARKIRILEHRVETLEKAEKCSEMAQTGAEAAHKATEGVAVATAVSALVSANVAVNSMPDLSKIDLSKLRYRESELCLKITNLDVGDKKEQCQLELSKVRTLLADIFHLSPPSGGCLPHAHVDGNANLKEAFQGLAGTVSIEDVAARDQGTTPTSKGDQLVSCNDNTEVADISKNHTCATGSAEGKQVIKALNVVELNSRSMVKS
jgi:hypothetical protein